MNVRWGGWVLVFGLFAGVWAEEPYTETEVAPEAQRVPLDAAVAESAELLARAAPLECFCLQEKHLDYSGNSDLYLSLYYLEDCDDEPVEVYWYGQPTSLTLPQVCINDESCLCEGAQMRSSKSSDSAVTNSLPSNSATTGTFSYNTTVVGTEVETDAKAFPQTITGGYTLDINNGAIKLAASEYNLTVANDFVHTPEAVDNFGIDFDSRFILAPQPIDVNGTPFAGTTVFIKAELNGPAATFADPGEPLLTADRPLTPGYGQSAFVGSSAVPRLMSITSVTAIVPSAGDYTVWRDALGGASTATAIPEPLGMVILLGSGGMLWRQVTRRRR